MIRAALILAIVWALGSHMLWRSQSAAKGCVIDIGPRDRAVALFWLPLLCLLALAAALQWLWSKRSCA